MEQTLVNLNVNPCKMCMPMGSVMALYGIKKCMSILHGSQGCSTYIRRHMATHYNEPVDIASSSLTEEGTVYGGEENLKKGLKNLINLYSPEVIGVSTTCLAETIGEDVPRIIDNFYEENPEYRNIPIISVPTAGYQGTQFEGFFKALFQVVKTIVRKSEKNHKVNIITGPISPGDTRYLKNLLEHFEIDYILLPDLSENLDSGYHKNYDRLPSKGASIEEIAMMGGARYTLELSTFTNKENSPAEYLYREYQIPYKKLNLPMSLRDIDALIKELKYLSGKNLSEEVSTQRERYLDAMIDSHKYNSVGRAVVFGEPDFVYGTVRLCAENGIVPILVATGSKCPELKEKLQEEVKQVAESAFVEQYEILDDVDFQIIEKYAKKWGANLLIGNSDARRIEENLHISLVRRSFPIHDRIGGQRLLTLGYEGTLTFLDEITNTLLAKTESSFRRALYEKYYKGEKIKYQSQNYLENRVFNKIKNRKHITNIQLKDRGKEGSNMLKMDTSTKNTIEQKTKTHPCFNSGASDYARVHLPVAPKCNISCNYCLRKYDCPNESRPGVTTEVLSPEEAYERYLEVDKQVPNISVVGIAGPGDALANFEETKKTLQLIKESNPDITFCISTNGLMLPVYANELVELGVSHVTVTMNAIDPTIGAQVYKYVEYMGVKYKGEQAASILMANQMAGIKLLTDKGIICKVNIVMLKGINEKHIPEVVKKVKELGGTITNIMQLIPVKGSAFQDLPLVSNKEIMDMRKTCGETMSQMYHCKQCRADAIGTLGNDRSIEFSSCKGKCGSKEEVIQELQTCHKSKLLRFAAATKSGMIVDQHFGQVSELYIYEYTNGSPVFKEKRNINKYCTGNEECGENDKISMIVNTISDCDGVIAMRIGEAPSKKLEEKGIRIFTTYDRIEDAVILAASEILK
ncbi:nitrogenase cofactor biosynthesis protein NifB [Anaeromicropila herbilytica]|uniref:FeMo cofactor biosynthesis protein NifB n=1 Tax=Anaeromicropila herbilytica TaxID=2785025 RepID=A0A7R7EPY5_9FIRM|nr:nitrogenase cofactor biosynthesis protein NifB [Anaeromicropila herbilytica]BCN32863.1 nitrogenase cofactor biosynthesis protein NifB [Anaeromicropila herbilytica]